ncbi:unnamed protein product [Mytilus coruscus]|uniref:B box-type domain-containing protein n=1 Tax=Mytilus coruscus TaxID=42192 RepID=A0A6J8B0B1_MYTCO|nr:unnamed protein product [Mytilus coruscus]
MCNSCKTVHEKITTLTGHSLIKYEEVNSFPTTSLMQAIKCHHHNGENREFYCSDHCTSFCFICFLQDHRRCEHSERIEKIANDMNQSVRIEEIINRIEKQQKSLETIHDHKHSTLQALNEERPKLEAEMSALIEKLTAMYYQLLMRRSVRIEEIINRIEKQQKSLQTIHDHKNYNLQALNEERPKLEAEMTALIEKVTSHVRTVIYETGNLLNTEINTLEGEKQDIKRNLENLERQKIEINQFSNVCTHSNTFLYLHEIENIVSKNDEKFGKMKSNCNLNKPYSVCV